MDGPERAFALFNNLTWIGKSVVSCTN